MPVDDHNFYGIYFLFLIPVLIFRLNNLYIFVPNFVERFDRLQPRKKMLKPIFFSACSIPVFP